VADEIERWVDQGGIDGFLFMPPVQPKGFAELSDLLLPELDRRGLHERPDAGPPLTIRERFFGPGRRGLSDDHPGRVAGLGA
jgi:hypothetical protein